jgi:uncharacterized protein
MRIKRALKKESVVLCYLFGSFARGEEHKESDIDIAVMFDKKVEKENFLKKEGRLISLFSGFFPGREINVVNLEIASPLLRQNVILEGRLIYARNEDARILFQMDALRKYEEFRHLSNIYNLVLKEKIKAL